MEATIISIVISIISSTVAAVIAYLLALRRFRKEALERLRIGYYEKQIEAYQQFWCLLAPTSYYEHVDGVVIEKKEDQYFLNINHTRKFFKDIGAFFYSEHGMFLTKDLRKAIFETRDYVEGLFSEGTQVNDDLFPISNTKAKKVQKAFNWVRTVARNDIGLRDIKLPKTLKKLP